jgi:multidrug resistance efflux pump
MRGHEASLSHLADRSHRRRERQLVVPRARSGDRRSRGVARNRSRDRLCDGDVEPVRWAKVASVIRERIIEVCNCEGRAVAKSDVLVRLDDKEPRAQLLELKAREDFAQREFARQSELVARGTSTAQAHERVSIDLRTIQGLISVQMEKLANYVIAAPMDGVVLRQDGEVGEIVEAGQILVRIGALKPLQVVAEVNEEDIPRCPRKHGPAAHRRLLGPAP